jgi:uncharacterized membrane protein (DUF2068 family)
MAFPFRIKPVPMLWPAKIHVLPMHPHFPHPRIDDPAHIKGVRTVATLEFTKGIVVVLAGLGVFSMRHKDIWGVAESFLEFFHVNPYHHYVGVFINLIYRISDVRLWKIALVAAIYAVLRFIEAYGLWYIRPWAEWLAILSGSIYIPFEVADLLRAGPDWLRVMILTINVAIVLYMLALRLEAARKRHAATQAESHQPLG